MVPDKPENKANYFFDRSLKQILVNSNKPLFGVDEEDSYIKSSSNNSLSKSSQKLHNGYGNDVEESLDTNKQLVLTNVSSWKEFFFFSKDDERISDGDLFFNSLSGQETIEFREVRKKLKQCIRHKMSKRRNVIMKNKFIGRKFRNHMYKKMY